MLPVIEGFDPAGPMWQAVVREYLIPKREDLREQLASFQPDASRRDNSDFLRGSIDIVNELIHLSKKESK